jgi:hypothetical protein
MTLVTNRLKAVLLDAKIGVSLSIDEDLLGAFLVLDSKFVEAAATLGAQRLEDDRLCLFVR